MDYLRIKDTTPRASAKGAIHITVEKAPVHILRSIIDTSRKHGVDPYAALAEAWKETGFSTNQGQVETKTGKVVPRLPRWAIWENPMQYNVRDLAPKTNKYDHLTPEEREMKMRWLSEQAFNKKVEKDIVTHPLFRGIDNEAARLENIPKEQRGVPEYVTDKRFNEARRTALNRNVVQNSFIEGGIKQLSRLIEKNPGSLENAFARYRGVGQPARYHGRHVMELYNALKRDPGVRSLVETGAVK